MTQDTLLYLLTCGCAEPCGDGACDLEQPHVPGTRWLCDKHGLTTVKQYAAVPAIGTPVNDGDIVGVESASPVVLADGHPMRVARCVVCSRPLGGEPVTVVAVAGLGGPACLCGRVTAAAYLMHTAHQAMPPARVMDAIEVAMTCQADHP